MKNKKIIVGTLLATTLIAGCTNDFVRPEGSTSYTAGGAMTGAAVGAGIGQMIGGDTEGTLVGAAIGGLLGTAVGNSMQQQENAFRSVLANSGVGIVNTGNSILLTLPGGLTFKTDQAQIKGQFARPLSSIAYVLKNYPNSRLRITGHTDSTGSYKHNLTLSEQRANSVRNFLLSQGVSPERMTTLGVGPDMPVASNDTREGRELNRRVTIEVLQ